VGDRALVGWIRVGRSWITLSNHLYLPDREIEPLACRGVGATTFVHPLQKKRGQRLRGRAFSRSRYLDGFAIAHFCVMLQANLRTFAQFCQARNSFVRNGGPFLSPLLSDLSLASTWRTWLLFSSFSVSRVQRRDETADAGVIPREQDHVSCQMQPCGGWSRVSRSMGVEGQ